jgi:hypothetical protein
MRGFADWNDSHPLSWNYREIGLNSHAAQGKVDGDR